MTHNEIQASLWRVVIGGSIATVPNKMGATVYIAFNAGKDIAEHIVCLHNNLVKNNPISGVGYDTR